MLAMYFVFGNAWGFVNGARQDMVRSINSRQKYQHDLYNQPLYTKAIKINQKQNQTKKVVEMKSHLQYTNFWNYINIKIKCCK